jgi:hypothetical protein
MADLKTKLQEIADRQKKVIEAQKAESERIAAERAKLNATQTAGPGLSTSQPPNG